MSASDSDYSIDWLASDDEDIDSELEPDCDRAAGGQARPGPLSPGATRGPRARQRVSERGGDSGSEVRGGEEEEEESLSGISDHSSSCGSPSSCSGSCDGGDRGQERAGYPWDSAGPAGKQRQAQKRPRSSGESERRDRQQLAPGHQTEKDRLFASKCVELQCYIHPLSSILNGLRSGRYRERLSTFQESVAMDRIQRIMGVLQNPCMGERYVNIILKMEEMLKSWFPHVKPRDQHGAEHTQETGPSKKQKLSSAAPGLPVAMANALTPSAMRVSDLAPPGFYSATSLKWLHTSPICSTTAEQAHQGALLRNRLQPVAGGDRHVTQDNAVSSSTDSAAAGLAAAARGAKTDPVSGRPPPGKINAPCLERLLKSTESIITRKGAGGVERSGWS